MKVNQRALKIISKLSDDSFDRGKVNPTKVRFAIKELSKLSTNNAVSALTAFLHLFRSKLEANTLTIESATRLSENEIATIVSRISQTKTVYQTIIKHNSSLKLGVKIRMGDDIIEDDFSSRANLIKEVING